MRAATARFTALGTTVVVICADEHGLVDACRATRREIDAIDLACSRFRDDSELVALNEAAGRPVTVSPVLFEAIEVAMRAAELSNGRVTPTIGEAIRRLGYDRTFVSLPSDGPPMRLHLGAAPSWHTILLEPETRRVLVPAGVELDLGATAKALAVDRATAAAADTAGAGVLVSIGGDLAVGGPAPAGGWAVQVADDHAHPDDDERPRVAVDGGALATSGTANRRWHQGGIERHHLIDPARSESAPESWRTVTVAAATCVDANIASTASMIMGLEAPAWLEHRGLSARLATPGGAVTYVGGWPRDRLGIDSGPPLVTGAAPR